ncbi:pterin-4-alpha-carbinolamine dehydratase [Rugosibacter aromaticivorans]|uniref:Putative pterin-4-alpha-carbinolamine dehydratase n=1 Tax=Rugosibacter aromaticivorans TaxID=1565605 RepID=A0A0C5J9N7_9PROT|nr:4a-hydroxytetrahydrobiopterin dehydratase [Rugosibacter aromaticivorans]AJP48630.1 pterin-4-alpha-carbinolamine dehydratase [Rugosibacter aromaticivorans]TBR14008.1 MAG: 4a-hydroxytetrahydrobiopterin dehydratase [Rugosibacter sp.]
MTDLKNRRCVPCEGGVLALDANAAEQLLARLSGWQREVNDHKRDHQRIFKIYRFKNYHETMAFVNATAWVSHREDHHPDLTVSYNECKVSYTTHAIGGLSENDFICAAKIDALFEL